MQSLEDLNDIFDNLITNFRDDQRKLHEELATELKATLDRNISATVNDSHGRVRGWQVPHVGSGGGYAAVRATDGKTGPDSPGAITNYLENGHRIRASTLGRAYRSRIRMPYVRGRYFYQTTRGMIESVCRAKVENFARNLASEVNR